MKKALLLLFLFTINASFALEHYKRINFAHKSTELTQGSKDYLKLLCSSQKVNDLHVLNFLSDEERVLDIPVQDSISFIRATKTKKFIEQNGLIHGDLLIQHQVYIVMPGRWVLSKQVRDGKVDEKGVYRLSVFKKPQFEQATHVSSQTWKEVDCQSVYINLSRNNVVSFRQGTTIQVLANSLVLRNGKSPKGINAELCVAEYYEKDDIIAADLCTVAGDKMLVSGGMVHVRAYCDEGELVLSPGKTIAIYMPEKKSTHPDMKTFHGKEKNGLLNWDLSESDGVEITDLSAAEYFAQESDSLNFPRSANTDAMGMPEVEGEWDGFNPEMERMAGVVDGVLMNGGTSGGHVLTSSKLDWINCDRFYEIENKTDMLVTVDTTTGVAVRMIFHDIKSVMPGYVYSKEKSASFKNIPVGERVTVIVYSLSKDETKVKFGMKDLLIGDKPVIDLSSLEEMSIDDMTQAISRKF